jgi:tetratricopeptide (TPR) repeat protein
LFALFFGGCSLKSPHIEKSVVKRYKDEDKYILFALLFQQQQNYKKAREYYIKLYEHTKKLEYLKEIIALSATLKDYSTLGKYIEKGLKEYPESQYLKRAQIQYYLYKKDYKKAKELTLKLAEKYKTEKNYELAGYVFLSMKEYSLALKFFERAYGISFNEDILNNIADILYSYLNRKDDAIAYLETHVRLRGCSKKICYKLLDIYAKEKDINGLLTVYKRLYEYTKKPEYAKKIAELYMYQGEKDKAISFLKKCDCQKEMLMEIYLSQKDFSDAYKVAKELYEETKDPKYLGKMAIYEYEGAKVKDKNLILSVADKFEKAIKEVRDPMYLNYYGYLLIDYDIDVPKGIKLVKEALKADPDSPYYLDSLAWGYYKLGRCKEAEKIMQKVLKMSQDKEVVEHMEKIKKCLKEEQ